MSRRSWMGLLIFGFAVAALAVTATLWLTDKNTGHTANSITTAAAALAVALLTIWATDRRQDKQLAHATERQTEQLQHDGDQHRDELEAEGLRQENQLRQERLLKAREELVDLVEKAAVALGVGRRVQENVHNLWKSGLDPDSQTAHTELTRRTSTVEDVRAAFSLLLLRYPAHHVLPSRYSEAVAAIDEYRVALRGYNEREDYLSNMPTINKYRVAVVTEEGRFLDVARRELQGHQLDTAEART